PSIHPETRIRYEWYKVTQPPALMPRWMVNRLRPQPAPNIRTGSRNWWRRFDPGKVDARVRGVLSVVSPDGTEWNNRLYWAACRAGEIAEEGGGDPQQLAQLILDAAG